MAKDKEKTEDTEENNENEGKGKKKLKLPALSSKAKLIIVIVAGLLFLGGMVGGTLYFLGVFGEPEEDVAEEVIEETVQTDLKPPAMYFPIKPAFIVNFQSRGRQRYLQVEVSVMTREQDVFSALQQHLPLVKNKLVMLFSGEVYEDLQTDEGRELMRQKALEAVQNILTEEIGKPGAEQVLFTNFVMQ